MDSPDSHKSTKASDESIGPVVAALIVNSLLFGGKLAAWIISGGLEGAPLAMLAEVLHSLGDSTAQALLLVGIYKAARRPDKMFPFGYGRERFRWSSGASVIILILAGGTILHGAMGVAKGAEPHIDRLSLVLFVCAAAGEGCVWCFAFWHVQKERKKNKQSFRQYLKETSNPSVVAVLLEDAVAVIGIALAFSGIGLFILFGISVFDGIATILIGVLMGVMGYYLWDLNGKLLVGRASSATERRIREVLGRKPAVKAVREISTVFIGVEVVRAHVMVAIDDDEVEKHVVDYLNGDAEKLIADPSEESVGRILRVHDRVKGEIMKDIKLALWDEIPEIGPLVMEEELNEEQVPK